MANQPAGRMQVGLVLPIAEDQALGGVPRYALIRDWALRAEALGFDSIWVYDHLLFRDGDKPTEGIWECWSMLAALAEATRRVQLGTIVMCVPFRNPAVLAKMADTLDEISGGRLILGLGAGWHQPEFDAFGVPFDHKVDRFEEALQIIVPLLRDGQVDFTGTYYRAPNCELRPRGPRQHGPEILIGSFKPRMHGLVARYADSWNTAWLGLPGLLAERRAPVEAACVAAGRDPATLGITVGVHLMYFDANTPPSPPTEKVLTGSPAEVAATLRSYADQGVNHLICSIDTVALAAVDWLGQALALFRAAGAG